MAKTILDVLKFQRAMLRLIDSKTGMLVRDPAEIEELKRALENDETADFLLLVLQNRSRKLRRVRSSRSLETSALTA